MVGKVIRDYMEGGAKKLTVPGFGTFMRRESESGGGARDTIIFVDLLRGDDKTLSEMVEDRGGYSELEAMALIDRFIFETKHAIERHGSSAIEGFGTLTLDHKGVYQFNYIPSATARPLKKETAVQERLFEADSRPSIKTDDNISATDARKSQHSGVAVKANAVNHSKEISSRKSLSPTPKKRRPKAKKNSSADVVLIVALVAAAIALVALIFGMSSGNMPFLPK